MLLYLDNWTSVRNAPNENQGRELLELHTVGRGAGYTEADGQGLRQDPLGLHRRRLEDLGAVLRPAAGTPPGRCRCSASPHANAAADGRALTVDYLRYLAHHPATATRIATKLCRHFVADEPSAALVDDRGHRRSPTPARTSRRRCARWWPTPTSWPARHAGAQPGRGLRGHRAGCSACRCRRPPTASRSPGRCIWLPETTLLYQWPRPDGLPLGDAAWSSATRMLNSFRMHWNLAAGWWPTKDVAYRTTGAAWLPRPSLRLDEYVDHLSPRAARHARRRPRRSRRVAGVTGYPGEHGDHREPRRSCGWMFAARWWASCSTPPTT